MKKQFKKLVNTNHSFSFGQELTITIIDQIGPIIGGCCALAAALIERETLREAREEEEDDN